MVLKLSELVKKDVNIYKNQNSDNFDNLYNFKKYQTEGQLNKLIVKYQNKTTDYECDSCDMGCDGDGCDGCDADW